MQRTIVNLGNEYSVIGFKETRYDLFIYLFWDPVISFKEIVGMKMQILPIDSKSLNYLLL